MKILQGQNNALKVLYGVNDDLSLMSKFSGSLWLRGTLLKKWSIDDVTIDNDDKWVALPLTEAETMGFNVGDAKLEVKFLDDENKVYFLKRITVPIHKWNDDTVLTDGETVINDDCVAEAIPLQHLIIKKGADGKDGSDAEVTEQNIANALGYTPANQDDVSTIEEDITTLGEALETEVSERKSQDSLLNDKVSNISQSSRVSSLNELNLVNSTVIETDGVPDYIDDTNISNYSNFGISEKGWYVFARIKAKDGIKVTEAFSINGQAGYIVPTVGNDYVDIAVKFNTTASSQNVVINWGTYTETFVFKCTDLAIRNLDYRVTYYVYDIKDYTSYTYSLTSDTTFVDGTKYFVLDGEEYKEAEVTVGDTIPSDTYYVHSGVTFSGFTRNVSYTADEIDCPVTIELPEVTEEGYGAWFEIQTTFSGAFSVTFVPPEGVQMSTSMVVAPKKGINMINAQYHEKSKTWFLTNTVWTL